MEKILTSADIVTNSAISISDVSTPYVDKIGDNLHFYIGIRASSLCYVRLVFNDDYEQYGGMYSLERLLLQKNIYALHLTIPEYAATAQEPEYRVSNFSITAKTCEGDVSKETFFNINQKRCLIETYTVSVKNYTLLDDFGGEFYIDEPGVKEKQLRNGDTYTIYANPYDKYKVLGEITKAPFTENYIPVSIMDSYTSSAYTCTGDITHYVIFGRPFKFNMICDASRGVSGISNSLRVQAYNMCIATFSDNLWKLGTLWGPMVWNDTYITTYSVEWYFLPNALSSTLPRPSDDVYINTYATPGEGITLESYSVKDEYGNELSDGTSPYNIKNIFDNSSDEYSVKAVFVAEHPQIYYTVTFNLNGHGTPAPAQQTVQDGSTATEPDELEAIGQMFGGWYKEQACENAWDFETDTVTGDTTLWAKWELSAIKFTAQNNVNSTISLSRISTKQNLWYTYTPESDESWAALETGVTIPISSNENEEVYVCGELTGRNIINLSNDDTGDYTKFSIEGDVSVSNNVNSLWHYKEINNQDLFSSCGARLFKGCSGLTDASELVLGTSATTLDYYCYLQMFCNCKSLTTVPQNMLPATNLSGAGYCYSNMFEGCSSLETAPKLPATTLENYCYQYMFKGCTSLTSAPYLPAETMKSYCYRDMFNSCTGLTTVQEELQAMELADSCYNSMFEGCTSLTTAPYLPAETMKSWCYADMFNSCTGLTTVQEELQAMELADSCYLSMFYDCVNLTTAPYLPAETMEFRCYCSMFMHCSKLTSIQEELQAMELAPLCYKQMFSGCYLLSISPRLPATVLYDQCYSQMLWATKALPDCTNIDFESETVVQSGGLRGLFAGTNITDEQLAAILPINPETRNCWLPITNLADSCYESMFYGCNNITVSPELPATVLYKDCYDGMFGSTNALPDCTNIDFESETVVQSGGLRGLFRGTKVTDSDLMEILPKNQETNRYWLPVTNLAEGCYQNMFNLCENLKTAPELPATTLTNYCYYMMFYSATNLESIKCLATDISASYCTYDWVRNVRTNGTFICPSGMQSEWNSKPQNSGKPTNWEYQNT